ncbi:MAG: hypothetical protein ACRDXX_15850 [Stackebrandtia sp.]
MTLSPEPKETAQTDASAPPRRNLKLLLGWGAAALLTLHAAWQGGLAMDVVVGVMWVVEQIAGSAVLPFEPDWFGALHRSAAAGLAAVVAIKTLRYQRVTADRCGGCGRNDRTAVREPSKWSIPLAYAAILPAGGYAALKLQWAFGGTFGLDAPGALGDVKPWSPGFADTAVMAAVGVAIGLAMAYRRPRLPRWILLAPAGLGCLMLLPVGVLGTAGNILGAFSDGVRGGMSPWVPWFVYGCFLIWGACLAAVAFDYYRRAGVCRTCGRGQA